MQQRPANQELLDAVLYRIQFIRFMILSFSLLVQSPTNSCSRPNSRNCFRYCCCSANLKSFSHSLKNYSFKKKEKNHFVVFLCPLNFAVFSSSGKVSVILCGLSDCNKKVASCRPNLEECALHLNIVCLLLDKMESTVCLGLQPLEMNDGIFYIAWTVLILILQPQIS